MSGSTGFGRDDEKTILIKSYKGKDVALCHDLPYLENTRHIKELFIYQEGRDITSKSTQFGGCKHNNIRYAYGIALMEDTERKLIEMLDKLLKKSKKKDKLLNLRSQMVRLSVTSIT